MTAQKKITKATFKSFLRKNDGLLFVKEKSRFDGMYDCVMQNEAPAFRVAMPTERHVENTAGFEGIWLVGDSRDYFSAYSDDQFEGFAVSNCCGSFIVATPKKIA